MAKDVYYFDVQDDQITSYMTWEDGQWQEGTIDSDNNFTLEDDRITLEEQDEDGATQTSLFEATQIPGFYTLEEGDGITDDNTNEDGDVVNEDDDTIGDDVVDEGDDTTGDDVVDEGDDTTGDDVVDEGDDTTGDDVVDEGDDTTGDDVVDEGDDTTGDDVVDEGDDTTGDDVVDEGDDTTGDDVVDEGDDTTGDDVVDEGDDTTGDDVVDEGDDTTGDDVVDNGDTDTGDDVTDPTAGSADDFNAWLASINEANSDNAYSLLAGFDPVRLNFDNNQIQDLEKFDDGDWEMQEHTEDNQAFINQSGLLVREEMEDNGLETTFYQDADNDGIYFAIEQQFEEGGALTDASDQSVVVTMSEDPVTDPNTDTTTELAGVAPTPTDDFIA
ncbi:hypothetical protein BFW38_15615 [Terasakiispira papahanaumokuakeensis]|uniref:Uncharacterized protein n=1 Tax=Terasakiispira papahanaumokuakeensis TaxID=197479 RepID=A0A1E2VCR0_9GAMM|nr:hypothetical protein [Terasakiispira papahanaumokuakeensis]ODC04744.1 hypothetical protein BFW38_15615 [Terasakiispira papahanaumokuakeensis]